MAHRVSLRDGIIYLEVSGDVRAGDLDKWLADLQKVEKQCDPAPHRIADLRAATGQLEISGSEVWAAAKRRREEVVKNPIRSAIVGSGALQLGLARMYQTLDNNPRVRVEVFEDMEKAMDWIKGLNTGKRKKV